METPLKAQSIIPRIDGIQRDVEKLKELVGLSFEQFENETNFVLAQYYLRRALEGVFHIGLHLLSRLPGNRSTEYKAIAIQLGECGVVEKQFAQTALKNMAGYRNRLTHFYADVTPKEIYSILQKNLGDFDVFLKAVREVMKHPEKYGFSVEK